jgi:hypothetical protein
LSLDLIMAEVKKKALKVQAVYDSFDSLRKFAELQGCEPAGPYPGV